jgi:hypothetical protein
MKASLKKINLLFKEIYYSLKNKEEIQNNE